MTNSKRKCPLCSNYNRFNADGTYFDARSNRQYCNFEHFVENCAKNGKKLAESHRKKVKAEIRKEKRKFDDNSKKKWQQKTQKIFNKYIRTRDRNLSCISCETTNDIQYHAGHYLSVGAHPNLRYEEDNCHKQCVRCNNYKSGNLANYRINLVKKIGLKRVLELEADNKSKHYKVYDLKQIYSKCKQLLADTQNE